VKEKRGDVNGEGPGRGGGHGSLTMFPRNHSWKGGKGKGFSHRQGEAQGRGGSAGFFPFFEPPELGRRLQNEGTGQEKGK